MNNAQLYLSVGIPSLLIVLTWINNNSRFNNLDNEMKEVKSRLREHDNQFLAIKDSFADVKDSQHKDALLILRTMTELHERLAVVEAKQGLR